MCGMRETKGTGSGPGGQGEFKKERKGNGEVGTRIVWPRDVLARMVDQAQCMRLAVQLVNFARNRNST